MNNRRILCFGKHDHLKSGWRPWSKYEKNIIHGDIMLSKDFKEFIELLNRHKVRYLVVGGYAPYIYFNGTTEEAFTFYKSVFGAEFEAVIHFRDFDGNLMGVPDTDT